MHATCCWPGSARTRRCLERTCDLLGVAARDKRRLTPANEWLLDNIYLVEEQIRIARRHLPKGYSRELPRLVDGPSAGLPRVYDIALNAISHGDGRIDAESLARFINAYQSVTPLKLGELWAIPIMLRLALIENLRRVSARIITDRTHRSLADSWADRFNDVAQSDPKDIVLVIADMVRSDPPVASAFVAELTRRLQGQNPSLAMPLTWIEQWLADSGHSVERHGGVGKPPQQATDQVSISNSIGSLRSLERMDWREFVESMSVVESILRKDPPGTYAAMDFATRDNYRHVVERIAQAQQASREGRGAGRTRAGDAGRWRITRRTSTRGRRAAGTPSTSTPGRRKRQRCHRHPRWLLPGRRWPQATRSRGFRTWWTHRVDATHGAPDSIAGLYLADPGGRGVLLPWGWCSRRKSNSTSAGWSGWSRCCA